jgi:NADP-dependent 3-hydroxy acid dehydrogenase YdfG
MAKALEANGASKVYIVGRRLEALEKAAKQSVSSH